MHVSFDILLLLGILAAVFGLSVYLGKSRMLIALYSLYIGTLIFSIFPYTSTLLGFIPNAAFKPFVAPVIFALLWAVVFFVLKEINPGDFGIGFVSRILQGGILTVVFSGVLLSVLYNILSFNQFYAFSDPVKSLIIFSHSLFWWFLAGIVASFFLLRR